MILPIDHTKKVIADLQKIAEEGIDLVKTKRGFSFITGIIDLLKDFGDLSSEAIKAWPELKDLDSTESSELGKLSFEAISAVIKHLSDPAMAKALDDAKKSLEKPKS